MTQQSTRTVMFCALTVAILATFGQAEDWPKWRGPRGDGSWYGPPLMNPLPDSDLEKKWQVPIGPGYSGISVAGDLVYTMDKPAEPSDSERVVCFDAKTGQQRWAHIYQSPYGKLDYGSGPRCTPTVHERYLYTVGAVGHVHCLDRWTGAVIWQKDLMKEYGAKLSEWGFAASAVVHRGKVFIHAGIDGGSFIAFDPLDGRELWRGGKDPMGYATPIVIRHAGTEQLVGWTPENVVGLSVDDGKELWSIPYKVTYGVSIATPIFHENTVLVAGYWEGTKAIRLGDKPTEASLLWEENRHLRGLMSQPLYRDGHVYLLDKVHGVTCFRMSDGERVWSDSNQFTKRDRNPQLNMMPLGDTDQILCLNAEGELIAARLNPQGFDELGRWPIIGPTWAHPALAGDSIYARDDKSLVCVRLPVSPSG